MNRSKKSMLPVWLGFGLVCFVIFVVVISVQLAKPEGGQNPQPVQNKPIRFDIVNDVDQAPTRRMLEIMLPHRVTQAQLQVISKQIRNALPHKNYKYISIRYQIPEMPYSQGIWAKAEFIPAQYEEIRIHGMTIPELKGFQSTSSPTAEQILGDWIIEDTSGTRRVLIVKDQGKYFYKIQWSPESGFTTLDLKKLDSGSRFVYLDSSEDTVYTITDDGKLKLSSNDGVLAVGRPLNSYQIPTQ